MKQVLTFIFCTLSITMRAQADMTYSHTDYSITYPSGWTLDTSGQIAAATFLYSPLENAKMNFQKTSISLLKTWRGGILT